MAATAWRAAAASVEAAKVKDQKFYHCGTSSILLTTIYILLQLLKASEARPKYTHWPFIEVQECIKRLKIVESLKKTQNS